MVQNIDHVVIAVNDLNEGIAQYEKTFGLKPSRTGERPDDGFKNAFYDLPGGDSSSLFSPLMPPAQSPKVWRRGGREST